MPGTPRSCWRCPASGSYTAAAVAAFAFGPPETVVDTNIRRVHARLVTGAALPAPSLTAAEMRLASADAPADDVGGSPALERRRHGTGGARVHGAVAEVRGLPGGGRCAWVAAGEPQPHYVPRARPWHGTDRQVRGAVMAVLREAESSRSAGTLLGTYGTGFRDGFHHGGPRGGLARLAGLAAAAEQLVRALDGLLADGLAGTAGEGISLPG